MDKKALRSTFGSPDDVFDIKLPWSGTEAPDVSDMFNGTLAVRFVYAGDSEMSGHLWPFLKCEWKNPVFTTGLHVSNCGAFLGSKILATKVDALFKHIIHTAWIDAIRCRDVMLIFAPPIAEPDINSIIERKPVRSGFRGGSIKHQSILIFESTFRNVDSASTVREGAQVLADSAATSPKAFAVKWKPDPPQVRLFHYQANHSPDTRQYSLCADRKRDYWGLSRHKKRVL
jgi:hypothetical protein